MDYRRELVGAFYSVFMHVFPRVKIRVDEEHSPFFASFYRARGMREQLLNVTVEHPYVHADPRPESERNYPMSLEPGTRRLARFRPACVLVTVIPPGESSTALQRHALAALARFLREEERGYAQISTTPLPTDHIARERPMLPVRAIADAEPGELVLHRTTAEPLMHADAYALGSGGEATGYQVVQARHYEDGTRVIEKARLLSWGPSDAPLPQLPKAPRVRSGREILEQLGCEAEPYGE